MTKSVRAELNRIQKFLLKGGRNAIDLWAILTALRGPDDNSDSFLKASTTEPIRTKAFPVLAREGNNGGIPAGFAPRSRKIDSRAGFRFPFNHFLSHVDMAAVAIARRGK